MKVQDDVGAGIVGLAGAWTIRRPVMRRLVTRAAARAELDDDILSAPADRTIRSPATAAGERTPGGATAIFARRTSTRAIVLPTTASARPRAIVSTSGSSGTLELLAALQMAGGGRAKLRNGQDGDDGDQRNDDRILDQRGASSLRSNAEKSRFIPVAYCGSAAGTP